MKKSVYQARLSFLFPGMKTHPGLFFLIRHQLEDGNQGQNRQSGKFAYKRSDLFLCNFTL